MHGAVGCRAKICKKFEATEFGREWDNKSRQQEQAEELIDLDANQSLSLI